MTAKIIRQERDCTRRGWETWIEGDPVPFFRMGPLPPSQEIVDGMVQRRAEEAARLAQEAEDADAAEAAPEE